jgi:hypothetical protein
MGRGKLELAPRVEPRLITFGDKVFRVRPVNSDKLARVGHAHLEGSASYKEAMSKLRIEVQKYRDQIAGLPIDKREERERLADEANRLQSKRRLEAFCATPDGELALLDRCTSYICAMVTGAGRMLETTEVPPPGTIVSPETDPATVLMDLRNDGEIEAGRPPIYVEEIRFVAREEEQDLDKGHYWVYAAMDADARVTLGTVLMNLQSVAHLLEPFRLRPRGAVDSGQAGEEVQQHTVSSAPVVPVRAGAQPGSGRRGPRSRQKAG